MNVYIRALRAPFLAGSLIPVVIGSAYAFLEESFHAGYFLITALGVAGLHTGANLINDYYDARGSDPINVRFTPFSGGSRVIPDHGLRPGVVLAMALFFFALGAAAGAWLTLSGRPMVALIGLMGLASGWAYSAPPFHLMTRGWGEVLIFLAFGPLITLGTAYVMTGALSWAAFAAGFPQGFFIAGVIWINQFPDHEADGKAGKRNLVVRLGPRTARWLYAVIMAAAFFSVLYLVSGAKLPYTVMLSVVSIPLGIRAVMVLWTRYTSYEEIVPAQALTIQTMVAHGLLLSLGLALGRLLG